MKVTPWGGPSASASVVAFGASPSLCFGDGVVSPVPAFDGRGLLPPFLGADETTPDRSPYVTTVTELVGSFGMTPARHNLLFGLIQYREMLSQFGYSDGMQFIDGSFVENVELRESRDPDDIDVFSFLVRPANYRNNPAQWNNVGYHQWTSEIADRNRNKLRFGLDTYAIAVDQHGPLRIINETIYWYSLFAHGRMTHDWKGFVRLQLDPADDATARTAITSGP